MPETCGQFQSGVHSMGGAEVAQAVAALMVLSGRPSPGHKREHPYWRLSAPCAPNGHQGRLSKPLAKSWARDEAPRLFLRVPKL
jgi:hypothetical protein